MNLKFLAILLLIGTLSTPCLLAAEETKNETEPSKTDLYLESFDKKIDRGAVNFAAGWTELLREPVRHYQSEEKGNRALKTMEGFGIGIFNGVVDTAGGFLNAATSLLPQWEIPLPEGGVQAKNITGGQPEEKWKSLKASGESGGSY